MSDNDSNEEIIGELSCGVPVRVVKEKAVRGDALSAAEREEANVFNDEIPTEPFGRALSEARIFHDEDPTPSQPNVSSEELMESIATSERPTVRMKPLTKENA